MWPHDFTKEEDIAGGEVPAAGGKGGLGAESPAANGFYFLFFHIKKNVLSKKDISVLAVSTVTIRHIVSDNAKIF